MRTMRTVPALLLGAILVCGLPNAWSQESASGQEKGAKQQDAKKAGYAANAAARNGSHQKPSNVVQVGAKSGNSNDTKHKPHHDPQGGTQSDSTTQPK